MDIQLREAERRLESGDPSALADIYALKIRNGSIPIQYVQILAMVGDVAAQQVAPYTLIRGRSYPYEIQNLLKSAYVDSFGRRTLYEFYLAALRELQTTIIPLLYPDPFDNEYGKGFGQANLAVIDYFQSLGPNNLPHQDRLITIMRDIQNSFSDRVEQLVRHNTFMDCTELVELILFDIAGKFVWSEFERLGYTKNFTISWIHEHLDGEPDFSDDTDSRFIFDAGQDHGWCESLDYNAIDEPWPDFFFSFQILQILNRLPNSGNRLLFNFVRHWMRDWILSA